MAVKVIMPKLGLTMTEGKIVRWLKNEGDPVNKGEPLLEIMTEKIVTEVESPGDGILAKIFCKPDEKIPVTQTIAVIAADGENIDDLISEIEFEAGPTIEVPTSKESSEEARVESEATTRDSSPSRSEGRIKASPLAKRIAQEHGIIDDLAKMRGTGPGGRIVKKDVLSFLDNRKEESFYRQATIETRTEPISELRNSIASRMTESWNTPHFFLETEIDAGSLLDMRNRVNETLAKENLKISVTDLLVKIAAFALSENRYMNVSYADQGIIYHGDINTGVAVAIDDGLIVPVLRNADQKGIRQIARESKNMVERARAGQLSLDEVTGGTFTISNLGMYPVDAFTAVLNPPEAAIMAIGRVVEKPVCLNGDILIRSCMRITLSFDHRAVDGAQGARFIGFLKNVLENPYLLNI